MAKWSATRVEPKDKEKEDRLASILTERSELFARFRAGGWEINAVDPDDERQFKTMPDNWEGPKNAPTGFCHFRVKMPGALAARVRFASLLWMVEGVPSYQMLEPRA